MRVKTAKKTGWFLGCLLAIGIYLGLCGLSWILTCGIIKLITMCFGLTYSWDDATGIWLLVWVMHMLFPSTTSSKK